MKLQNAMKQTPFYTLSESNLVLDNPERRYVLRIRDLPKEDQPREKLFRHGPDALTTKELLAIILNSGTVKEGVLELSSRIMNEYGEQAIMHAKNPAKLAAETHISELKAAKIVAAGELGRRFFQKNYAAAPTIRTANEVFEYVQSMRDLPKEHLRGIYLNTRYKVIHDETISIGTVDANIIHPREVFKPALEYSAAAVILVHNHPSGSVEPSSADISVTKQLIDAGAILGIDLIDHIIVTKDAYASIPLTYQA